MGNKEDQSQDTFLPLLAGIGAFVAIVVGAISHNYWITLALIASITVGWILVKIRFDPAILLLIAAYHLIESIWTNEIMGIWPMIVILLTWAFLTLHRNGKI